MGLKLSFELKLRSFISLIKGKQPIFSAPEPKAHRWAYNIGRHPSSVRASTFSNYFSSEADSFHISQIASIGGGIEELCFLFQSDKNSGCYRKL